MRKNKKSLRQASEEERKKKVSQRNVLFILLSNPTIRNSTLSALFRPLKQRVHFMMILFFHLRLLKESR